MPKNIEDMIVPERRRSIRDIPIPEGRRNNNGHDIHQIEKPSSNPPYPTLGRRKWRERKSLWIASGIALLVLIFATLSLFDGATLAYIPKSKAISFTSDTYTAQKTGEGELLYSVVKLSGDKGLEVSASGEEKVERKASGNIIIYNTGTKAQKLIATTRFETPDNKIYHIQNDITVPAKGSLEATVYADRPGAEFNIGLSDFTLPGLKGTSSFSSVYARSKTEMSGGFVGVEKVVKSEDKTRVRTQLEEALRTELASEAKAQVPEDFILLPSLSSVTFEDLPQTNSTSKDSVTINMRANLSGVMFKRSDLSNHLALDKAALASGESVDIAELDSLSFAFVGTPPANLLQLNEVKFSVTGGAIVLWLTDEVALKADLIGKQKGDIPSILNNYPTILSATTTIRPFWKSSFPSDGTRISIKKLPVK